MRASLNKLDALIFTAGVGEHAIKLRETVCQDLSFLGINMNLALNQNNLLDSNVASENSSAQILLIEAREDWQIARECWTLLSHCP